MTSKSISNIDLSALAVDIKSWGKELGFQAVGISASQLSADENFLNAWLAAGFHGEMTYMAQHGTKRSRPAELIPGTLRVISARMNYLVPSADADTVLADGRLAYVARYALGRDYHKLLRARLAQLAAKIRANVANANFRVFSDSAPVLEKALARDSGLGWIGKNTNLLSRHSGSWFFLGEIYTDLPLPPDTSVEKNLCGSCTACLDVCPTNAFIGPYRLDARRCISYLTIELRGPIPDDLRPLIGNRIFGCDDCQLVCPWNRYAKMSCEKDFLPRHQLDAATLLSLFAWTAADFDARTLGSPIRRIGYESWRRNLAVALGNAPYEAEILEALKAAREQSTDMVLEHLDWAIARHVKRSC